MLRKIFLLALFFLAFSALASATITTQQCVSTYLGATAGAGNTGSCTLDTVAGHPTQDFCGSTSLSCTYPITAIGSGFTGHVAMVGMSGNSGVSASQQTIVSVYDCTNSGGCNSGNTINTWTHDGNCEGYETQAHDHWTDCAYVLNPTSGATYITITRSSGNSPPTRWASNFSEISSGVALLFNAEGTVDITTQCGISPTLCPGISFSLNSLNNYAIFQMIGAGAEQTSISPAPPYSNATFGDHCAFSLAINTANGAAPSWTSGIAGYASGSAISFVEQVTPPLGTPMLSATGGIKVQGGILAGTQVNPVTITSTSPLPNCTFGIPFSFTFNATGGVLPYTWSQPSGTLQPGLSFSSGGVLSGSCTNSSGTDTFVIKVCDSESPAACAQGTFQQTAQNTPPPTLAVCDSGSSPACPNPQTPEVVGTFYGYNFNANGGTAPYSWIVFSGSIPTGETLSTAGYLSGFPSTPGTFSFTVQVTDSTTPTPQTATATFTTTVNGSTDTPQTALEPQNWVTIHQGGVNASTGNPCQPSDTNCTYSLPKTCNAANHCVHEQLGFGSNDYPATLAGLNSAGCDWASELSSTAALQGWSLWAEMKNGTVLTSGSLDNGTNGNNAMWNAPVKIQGWQPASYGGTPVCPHSPSNTPIGVWSIAGTITGNFVLGEVIQQQVTGAEANLYFYGCANTNYPSQPQIDAPPIYPRPCINGVVPGTTGVVQVGPIQVGPIVNGTPDGNAAHNWIGLSSGASMSPSASPAANGFFRLTGQCSPGAGSGKNGTFGGTYDTPCNNLTDQIPCYHSILDSSIVNVSPTGATSNNCYNDLPNMFTFALAAWTGSSSPVVIEQLGNNTSLSGFEVTVAPGIVQDMSQSNSGPCGPYTTVNCSGSPILVQVDCAACFRDHYWAHGWDPGDPAPYGGWGISQEQVGINAGYPVNGTDGHHECPTWSYNSTSPGSSGNPPITLTGPNLPYDSGCGEKVDQGVSIRSGGFTADEYFTVSKTHEFQDETHSYSLGHGADNLNPPPTSLVPGLINVGGNGLQGPHKAAHFLLRCTSECFFTGGSEINPTNGVLTDVEVRDFRTGSDPGYRFLSASAGHSPLASNIGSPNSRGYGCGQGTAPGPEICPFGWAMKKFFEFKYCLRCLNDGFIAENMWPDAQTGEGVAIDARVCSGGQVCAVVDQNGVPLTQSTDIRWTNGILRNAAGIFSISPRALGPGNGGGVSQGMNRTLLQNLLIYNLDQNQFGGSSNGDAVLYGSAGNKYPNCSASVSAGIETVTCPNPPYVASGLTGVTMGTPTGGCNYGTTNPAANTLTLCFIGRQDLLTGGTAQFSLNSTLCGGSTPPAVCSDPVYTAMSATGIDCRTMPGGVCASAAPGFYAPTCNSGIYSSGTQIGSACTNCGVSGTAQCPAFGATTVGPNSPYANDIPCSGQSNQNSGCGAANVSVQSQAFNLLDISPFDIVYVTGCTPGTFNTPQGGEPAIPNTYAISSQNPAALSVSFPAPSGLSGSTTSSTCQVDNGSGFQKNFIINHVGLYTGGQAHLAATQHGNTPQMLFNQMVNSIMYFGGSGGGINCTSGACSGKEANQGSYQTWDQQSNQIHHNVFVLPTTARAALYSAVGFSGSPFCPSAAGLNGGGNCVPATVGCNVSQTLDGNGNPVCLGLAGFLTTFSFPNTDCTQSNGINTCPLVSPPWGTFDYHNLALCTTCYSGGPNFFTNYANDGFQVGPCIVANHFFTQCTNSPYMYTIDHALQRTQYLCFGSCGLGPWPD